MTRLFATITALCAFWGTCNAFYIPGYSIKSYHDDESIPLFVNKIFSDNTHLQYAYFDLPFVCPPTRKKVGNSIFTSGNSVSLNLGEILRGDRIKVSDLDVVMGKNIECQPLCARKLDRKTVKYGSKLIEDGYMTEWILDNLPGATSLVSFDRKQKYYAAGFKLGYQDISLITAKPRTFLNNHFTIIIHWRGAPGKAGDQGKKVIVGFEVYPKSVAPTNANGSCPNDVHGKLPPLEFYLEPNNTQLAQQYSGSSYIPAEDLDHDDGATLFVPYSYSIYWREDQETEWSRRWDLYLYGQNSTVSSHWFSIFNSLAIATILAITVIVIWGRIVRGEGKGRDSILEEGKPKPRIMITGSSKSSETDADSFFSDDEPEDAFVWKLLHGDVFRTPVFSGLLAPFVGSGMQLLFVAFGLITLGCIGILNPSYRGGFLSMGIGLFVFAGTFSGYFSARLYKSFGGRNWRRNAIITALLFPGLSFSFVFVLNLLVWAQASSTALPFGTLIALVFLWLLIQLPLVYVGSWLGYRVDPWKHPTKTNPVARPIPNRNFHLGTTSGVILSGLVPFIVIFVELIYFFRQTLVDKSGYYYLYGYLAMVSGILLVVIAEVSIIVTYSQLCAEDHQWWWRSFLTGASSAAWIFMYCVWCYFTKLNIRGFTSTLLFFSYSFLACSMYSLLTGTVGFLTSYAFVRRIYRSLKVD